MDEHAPETRRPLTLIIDPDPVTQTLVATQTRQLGREPLVAGDGISGLDLAARHVAQLGLAVVEIRLPIWMATMSACACAILASSTPNSSPSCPSPPPA
jgi:CheY-like chemotaxis protein